MAIANENVELSCEVDGREDMYFIRVDVMWAQDHIYTLEFADISGEFKDLLEANSNFPIYDNEEDIKKNIAEVHLARILNRDSEDKKLNMLYGLVSKMKHSQAMCKDDCIYCNPDLGTDPVPDFTFEVKNYEHKGET